ncbi:MAG: O-antigen polysaccharide polymerase Wzy family protein [Eubacterium sp.]|nr:O-antigen polysaccharide polymerase Wzy family protein [Eubacterium sp.]
MKRIQKRAIKNFSHLLIILCIFLLLIVSIAVKAEPLLFVTLVIWLSFFINSVSEFTKKPATACFLLSFFVFLLGREVCYTYLGLGRYYNYLEPYNNFAYVLLSLSMIFIYIGNTFTLKKSKISSIGNEIYLKVNRSVSSETKLFQNICVIFFVICYICVLLRTAIQIYYVNNQGYVYSYTEEAQNMGVPAIILYIGALMDITLCLYLASYPPRKQAKLFLFLYGIYGGLTLFTGHRYTFISVFMFIAIYFALRESAEGNWIKKKYIIIVAAAVPFLLVFMNIVSSIRVDETYNYINIGKSIIDFFDQQGGSINVIKRIQYYKEQLTDMNFVSFSNVRSVLFENFIMRKITNLTSYSGNSIEHAMHGHSLSHRLSYYEYGNYYLLGHGVGSSYIAELFHDFSYLGVMLGSMFYGYILKSINSLRYDNFIKNGIFLAMIQYIILSPRDSFDNFVGGIFNTYSAIGLVLIWILFTIARRKNNVKKNC